MATPTATRTPTAQSQDSRVLFFIPDISGFTKFISETEVNHSQHIIKALLESLVDSNSIGLKVSEFEGDAILFYRPGTPPSLQEFIGQAKKMFINFHTLLKYIELHKICQCGGCSGASQLTLKIISHFGTANMMQVKDHTKLIGRDIIVAHRLLKNTIQHHEYFLMSDGLLQSLSPASSDLEAFDKGSDSYDEIGNVDYRYMYLGKYRDEVKLEPPQPVLVKNPVKVFEFSEIINAPAEFIYSVIIDLPLRVKWVEGVTAVEVRDEHNHIGTIHKCVQEGDDSELITSQVKVTDTAMELWETDTKKVVSCKYRVEKISPQSSRVILEGFLRGNPLLKLMFKAMKQKKMNAKIQKSLLNLKAYCERKAA